MELIYRQMLAEPGWDLAELEAHLGLSETEVRGALDRLFKLALIRDSADRPGGLHVVNPEVGLRSALARQQAELARRQQEVAESQSTLARLIDDFSGSSSSAEVVGLDAVRDQLAKMADETQFEILAFMPGGAQSAAALENARLHDTRVLGRGIRMRTVALDSIRNDPATLAYARFLTDSGAEFRTSALLPPRMVLTDRRAALVPLDPEDTRRGALYLTGRGVVASMLALFQQVWDIATPLGVAPGPDGEGLTGQERALLTLLAQGITDEAAAVRLGVSHRTVRRMMAELMERLRARSRFEAGLRTAQRGWL
jgi:DNA-binding CsgD family transcriptional regulator/sugar-specific transcriptional regulator TrmB